MRAVVLVGGFGTRLRPLTLTRPKQMLPVVDRPMLEHVLGHLAGHGIDDVVLSMGYRPDAFSDAYPDGTCAGVAVHYAVEPEPLDTAGAIRFAARDAGLDERFVVVNGDVLTDLDVSALVAFHEEKGAEGTIALHKVEDPSAFGVVPTDGDGRVEAFVEKPPRDEAPTDLINAGTYVLEPSVLDRIEPGRRVSIEREVFPAMVADGTLYATSGDTYWIDTGTPALYLRAQLDLLDGLRGEPHEGVAPDAEVHPSADVSRSVVGPGAVVGDGAVVCESAVLAGARIEPGARVERSVVAFDAVVGEAAELDGAVVGDGEVIAPGERLHDVRRPAPE
ncbi:NDP-sugar synthase [Iamia majanohamensis]|uniref:NDP-sugar synthase n=1 Tax=Iamia majanohamensis TaxID=467976 RepID=A0AAE9Y7V3_9ACTN|nr:NDP-sugar synthase [Iamia majanohamensis]WCO68615.1 NDP-sugar synthase [Iamia majanohamensis]